MNWILYFKYIYQSIIVECNWISIFTESETNGNNDVIQREFAVDLQLKAFSDFDVIEVYDDYNDTNSMMSSFVHIFLITNSNEEIILRGFLVNLKQQLQISRKS